MITRQTRVDLTSSAGRQIRGLLHRVDFAAISGPERQPDRFSYHLQFDDRQLTIGETQLTPELEHAIRIAFGGSDQPPR